MANSNFQRPRAQPYYDERDADLRRNEQESDPLAELARLIGQTDPLSTFSRDDRNEHQETDPESQETSEQDSRHDPRHEPRFGQDPFARDPYDARHRMTAPAQEPEYTEAEDEPPPPPSWLRGASWQNEQQESAPPVADDRYYQPVQPAYAAHQQDAQHGYYESADPRYDDALYGRAPTQAYDQDQDRNHDAGPPYSYPGHEQGYDDQYAQAEDEAPSRRRGGILTVAIVAALAVVGTAGAFAYRSFSTGTKSGEPAVIRADANPTKVVPPTASKDPSGKVITDRIGAQGERLVPREEAPLDVKSASAVGSPGGPRVVFPPLNQQGANSPAQGNAMVGGVSDEPKRIKTVSIRPDQAEQPRGGAPQATAPRQAAPAPAPAANNGPISLAPPRASAPETRPVASIPPAAPAPRATEGGYVVQVSSQRSEADAHASYRALQSRYPGVLASRSPLIKRADLGDKGVYYRAVVGPFASSEQATQVCGDLKNAGGQCVVQRN